MTEKQPDYMKGQQIYESLGNFEDKMRVFEVCQRLMKLYPQKGALYFQWWIQARQSGIIEKAEKKGEENE